MTAITLFLNEWIFEWVSTLNVKKFLKNVKFGFFFIKFWWWQLTTIDEIDINNDDDHDNDDGDDCQPQF